MPEPDNLVLVYRRRIDEKVDRVIDDVRDLNVRVTNVEEGQAGIHRRLDRVEMRLDRIERRLDLVEASH
jgi:IS4 transposase